MCHGYVLKKQHRHYLLASITVLIICAVIVGLTKHSSPITAGFFVAILAASCLYFGFWCTKLGLAFLAKRKSQHFKDVALLDMEG